MGWRGTCGELRVDVIFKARDSLGSLENADGELTKCKA